MLTITKEIFDELSKKVNLLHAVSNLDVKLVSVEGNTLYQLLKHVVPSILQHIEDDHQLMNETLNHESKYNYFHYINKIGLEFLATGVWCNEEYIGLVILGPFLSSIPSNEFISDLISQNKLPVSERKQLNEFYKSLMIMGSNESTFMGDLLVNICNHSYIDAQLISPKVNQPSHNKRIESIHDVEDKNLIDERYKIEKKLMRAIQKGDKEEIAGLEKETKSILNFSDRIPESPFRSAKNLLFVQNTLCRIAAEQGGLQPLMVHHVSEKFAILIERAPNLPYLKKLGFEMINEYCELVNHHSTKNYSTIVKKTVEYIHLNLEKPLTLKEIASAIHVHPSHLSRKFKQEIKLTVIDYVNQKRVDEAKLHLQTGNTSITEIALMVGYNDLNYFSRVFKKFTGHTPSLYVKNNRKNLD
jgi:two-component system, response regulator YesN